MAANMLSSMAADLLKSGKYSDCTLRCNGRDFKLHKNIICPQSSVLSKYFENHSSICQVDQFGQIHVVAVIIYMYIGEIHPKDVHSLQGLPYWDAEVDEAAKSPEETLEAALYYIRVNTVANFFQVQGLVQATRNRLQVKLDSLVDLDEAQILKHNAILLSAAQNSRDTQLQDIVARFTARHMKYLVNDSEFLNSFTLPFTQRIFKAMVVSEGGSDTKTESAETADPINKLAEPCENCEVALQLESEAIQAGSRVEITCANCKHMAPTPKLYYLE